MSKLTDLIAENRRLQRQVDYLAAETAKAERALLAASNSALRNRIAELEAAQRAIRSDEELETLRFDAMIQDKWGSVWQRTSHSNWRRLAVARSDAPMRIILPATVLWEPKEATP
ncbi:MULTISPECIES: hypothetical protein [Nocardia]|uniref:hypothetical protein n=1 Tax=Nocardia TaxID=1817 RepID=UPI0024557640|nr:MULTISPECIES: hypothetical protein [Nocardia]